MTKSETPDEKPRKKVAEDVVTAKRQYLCRSITEAETAKDAVSAAKEEAKKSEDGMPKFPGRLVSIGLGVESTPGTTVAPTHWMRHMSADFQRKTTIIQNESAMGRYERVNDSAVVETWAEGSLRARSTT